jgi:hypothetical protein
VLLACPSGGTLVCPSACWIGNGIIARNIANPADSIFLAHEGVEKFPTLRFPSRTEHFTNSGNFHERSVRSTMLTESPLGLSTCLTRNDRPNIIRFDLIEPQAQILSLRSGTIGGCLNSKEFESG